MLITGLNMPNMDGLELIQKIRDDDRHRFTPIVMLTTESSEEKKRAGREAGASGWIVRSNPNNFSRTSKWSSATSLFSR